MRASIMEVDIAKYRRNIIKIQNYIGKPLMPVVKANAYGTYLNKNIDLMNEFDIVAVALVDEAVSLRKNGYKNEVLVINQPYKDDLKDIVKYNQIDRIESEQNFLITHNSMFSSYPVDIIDLSFKQDKTNYTLANYVNITRE